MMARRCPECYAELPDDVVWVCPVCRYTLRTPAAAKAGLAFMIVGLFLLGGYVYGPDRLPLRSGVLPTDLANLTIANFVLMVLGAFGLGILLAALRAADLLTRERLQVPNQVRQEVVDDNPGYNVVWIHGPDAEREFELLVDLLRHRSLAVRGGEGALRDVRGLVGVREPLVLEDAPDPFADRVDQGLDLLRVGEPFGRIVERQRVRGQQVDVVRLLVDFVWIDACREDEGRVHQPAPFVRQERAGEVDEGVEEQDHGVFVSVAVPPAGGDQVGMCEARVRVRKSDDPREDPAARVRREREDEVAEEVLRGLRVVEALEAIEALQQVVQKRRDPDQVLAAGPRDEDVLGTEFEDLVGPFQGLSGAVLRVAEPTRCLDGDARLLWREVRQREVRHVEPGGAVLEDVDVVLCPQDAFLERLRRLRLRDHPLDRLDVRRLWLADSIERRAQDLREGNVLARRTAPRKCVTAARAFREEPAFPARTANAQADFRFDRLLCGRLYEEPLRAALVADREQGMRGRLHLAGCGFLGSRHPSPDPGRAPCLHGEPSQLGDEHERIRRHGCRAHRQRRSFGFDSEGREENFRVPLYHDFLICHVVRHPEAHKQLSRFLVTGEEEPAVGDAAVGRRQVAEPLEFFDGQVMEEQIVPWMKRQPELPGPSDCLRGVDRLPVLGQPREFLAQQGAVPLEAERPGHQDMVVLQELSERDQDFAEIRDDADVARDPPCGRGVRDLDKVTRVEDDERSFDSVARGHRARLPGPLGLDLGAYRDEVVEDVHRRGMQGNRREPRRPCPSVPEPEAAGPAWMAEDRPPRDDVLDEHLARLHAGFVLRLLGAHRFLLEVRVDEVPPVDPQFLHVFLDLRRLQAHAVRDHKAGASADPVRLDARQVPEAADLRLLGALAVDRDRAVRDDERDFLTGRGVLEMLDLAVD